MENISEEKFDSLVKSIVSLTKTINSLELSVLALERKLDSKPRESKDSTYVKPPFSRNDDSFKKSYDDKPSFSKSTRYASWDKKSYWPRDSSSSRSSYPKRDDSSSSSRKTDFAYSNEYKGNWYPKRDEKRWQRSTTRTSSWKRK